MTMPIVWADIQSMGSDTCAAFFTDVLGFSAVPGPGFRMLTHEGAPFAGIIPAVETPARFVPYFEVGDLDAAEEKARGSGAVITGERQEGPAGTYTLIEVPGGPIVALWRRAQAK